MAIEKRVKRLFFLACVLVVCWFAWGVTIANATKPAPHHNDVVDVDVDVTGGDITVPVDVTTGPVNVPVNVSGGVQSVDASPHFDSRALALSNSLGDVDIAGCLGSTQWSTPLLSKQKLVVNWPCLAEFYLRNAMYDNAAMAICNTEVRKEFETETACRDAHPFQLMAAPPPVDESDDEDEELAGIVVEQMAVIESQRAQMETYDERIAKLEQKKPTTTRVVNQVGLTDEQRKQLAEVFSK